MHNDKQVLKTKDTMNLTIQLTLDADYQKTFRKKIQARDCATSGLAWHQTVTTMTKNTKKPFNVFWSEYRGIHLTAA